MARRRRTEPNTPEATPASAPIEGFPASSSMTLSDEGDPSDSQSEIKADAAPAAPEVREIKPKLSIPMNSDGSIDLEGMRDSTKQRLFSAVQRLRAEAPEAGLPQPIEVPGTIIEQAYALLGGIEGFLIGRAFKVPPEMTGPLFAYSEPELKLLVPMSQKALAEWNIPAIPYPHTIALGCVLVKVTMAKIVALKRMMAENPQFQQRVNGADHTAHVA